MQHNWDKYFDTKSEYWEKAQKIYKENDNYPKIVVPGRNLHHKFPRSFSRLEETEIDNDKENLVSLSEGDHFLVHYYLWKCTKKGYRSRTSLPVRFMYKKAAKYLTDDIAELIAKEWTSMSTWNKGKKLGPLSEETKQKMSKVRKGKPHSDNWNKKVSNALKGKPLSEETKRKMSKAHKGKKHSDERKRKISEAIKGKHWKLVEGKRIYY